MRPTSLRARLLLGMVVLVASGLAVAAVATYEVQRSFLLDRVDQQVQTAMGPLAFVLRDASDGQLRLPAGRPGAAFLRRFGAGGSGVSGGSGGSGGGAGGRAGGPVPGSTPPPGTFGELLGPGRKLLARRTFSYGERLPAPPALPATLPLSQRGAPLRVFTLGPGGGSDLRYRAAAFKLGGDTVVVAVPLREVDLTLHRLVITELLVGGGVILALIVLGWIVIRLGLRPLERIGRTASEIAGGDLSRRVTPADARTEVGRLGLSLNEMLSQIERAFRDRARSESRLRRFLADASHELRTPLASIRGYAELFRLGAADDPETLDRAMGRIESEAKRMGVLVDDMLLLARLDEEPEPRRLAVDVCELVEHAAQDASVLAPDREIAVACERPMTVLGDGDQLRQLLANLVRNALLHTPPGTALELSATRAGEDAVLAVRDHGPGLPSDAGDQIFERFWRSEGGRSRGAGGAGLGLAIVRAVAEAHGGSVSAANAPDGGAVFTVTLPATVSQETLSLLTTDSYPDGGH
jgi:two-component system, OmpR family, sensor kinase